MSLDFPLFTDQGPLIATAFVLQGVDQTTEYGDGNETERTLMIYLNIMICVMHFIRGAFHDAAKSMKTSEPIIQRRILAASRAHTQHEFFDEILSMVLEILNHDQESGSRISEAIDVALYILKVDPTHWSTFARGSAFDRAFFLSLIHI